MVIVDDYIIIISLTINVHVLKILDQSMVFNLFMIVLNNTVMITTFIIIMTTRPKPAYGRQGLASGSLCASGAQLRSGK